MKHYAGACTGLIAFSCALRATSFVVPLTGRAVSPTTHSWNGVSRSGGATGFASQWRPRTGQVRIRMSSETTDGEEPATAENAIPQRDVSPERKQEILDVLSAVIDPGKHIV